LGLAGLIAALTFVWCARTERHDVQAGTAVRMDLAGLVEHADLVLEGRVLAAQVRRAPSGRIDTEFTLDVGRTFFGEHQAQRTIRLPGGVLPPGDGMMIPGMPSLAVGEDVLLFLGKAHASGLRMPVGLAQGKFTVVRSANGAKQLARSMESLTLVDARTGALGDLAAEPGLDHAAVTARIAALAAHKRERLEHAEAR
jgi:hypothetical protein